LGLAGREGVFGSASCSAPTHALRFGRIYMAPEKQSGFQADLDANNGVADS